jgi:N-hydroxyarylamine O-acetyltransferase
MALDLTVYAARIGYTGEFVATLDTLRELHLAHALTIPFENLDALMGRPVRLDIESLWGKLVESRRGGYCFEHNGLFAAVLETAGFQVSRLAARVRMGATGVRPRTHMLLMVRLPGENWLADVGFGADGLLYPVPFRLGEVTAHFSWKYRVLAEGPAYVLQSERPEGWLDLYSFNLEEQEAIDYELANYFTSTHPSSPFVRNLIAQRPAPDLRLTLFNRTLLERTPDGASEILLPNDEDVLEVLSTRFSIDVPKGIRLNAEAYKTDN